VEKSALLLFGAIMAFSTRNVKGTFNESAAISWSIYNTLMSALIGVAIIVFVSAVEDALILLVLILLTWIVLSAWGLIFGPKFHLLMQSDEKVIEASRSQITQEKSNGFSFASIAAMTTGQVKQFYVALKLQVSKAERVLQLPQTVFGTGSVAGDAVSGGPTSGGRTSQQYGLTTKKSSGLHNGGLTEEQSYAVDITPVSKDREAERERNLLITVPSNSTALSVTHPTSPSAVSSAGGAVSSTGAQGLLRRKSPAPPSLYQSNSSKLLISRAHFNAARSDSATTSTAASPKALPTARTGSATTVPAPSVDSPAQVPARAIPSALQVPQSDSAEIAVSTEIGGNGSKFNSRTPSIGEEEEEEEGHEATALPNSPLESAMKQTERDSPSLESGAHSPTNAMETAAATVTAPAAAAAGNGVDSAAATSTPTATVPKPLHHGRSFSASPSPPSPPAGTSTASSDLSPPLLPHPSLERYGSPPSPSRTSAATRPSSRATVASTPFNAERKE